MRVRFRLGPLPASQAASWTAYARIVLDTIQRRRTPLEPLEDDLADAFSRYLGEWATSAAAHDPFLWESDEDRDIVARLATAWLELMTQLSGRVEELGLPIGPPEGEGFYHALVASIAATLEQADDAAHLGDKLREAWPALGDIDGAAPPAKRRLRVVIADDAADLRMVVRIALEQDGRFEVVGEAADGLDAVALCKRHRPDVVLLDIVMPRMDGWAALRALRESCPSAAVVVVSTLDEASAAPRAKELGAAGYVQKSVSLVSLTDTLARLAS